jgi:hypothetical protein
MGYNSPSLGMGNLDTQAFSASGPHLYGSQLAALYTLQHRLARDTERNRRLQHG